MVYPTSYILLSGTDDGDGDGDVAAWKSYFMRNSIVNLIELCHRINMATETINSPRNVFTVYLTQSTRDQKKKKKNIIPQKTLVASFSFREVDNIVMCLSTWHWHCHRFCRLEAAVPGSWGREGEERGRGIETVRRKGRTCTTRVVRLHASKDKIQEEQFYNLHKTTDTQPHNTQLDFWKFCSNIVFRGGVWGVLSWVL